MATAKEQAQKDLGDIRDYVNYSGYQKDIENARATYDTEIQSIQDKYNRLVDTINANRRQLGNDFTSGRSTVANEYYANRNLNTGAQLSSYLRGTGVNAANKTLNRMNLGNEFSKLANTYYHGQDELDTNLGYYQKDYDINKRNAENTLNASLANIGQKQKESENDYAKQVAQLAEQIQSRWDNNANAKAQLELQRSALAQQVKEFENQLSQQFNSSLSTIAGTNPTSDTYKAAMQYYRDQRGGTEADAYNYLRSLGIYMPMEEELKANNGVSDVVVTDDGRVMRTGETVPGIVPPISREEYNKKSKLEKWLWDLWGGQVR